MDCYLIAQKLAHSFSPMIHKKLADYSYNLKELQPNELEKFIKEKSFDGLNVTIPYKQEVIKYLDNLSEEAQKLQSVNTIVNKNGMLTGYNTDYYGFMYMVKKSRIEIKNKKVLIIGNGGASKTIQAAVKDLNALSLNVLTHKENTQDGILKYLDSEIIINTSPVGMFPNTGISPINLKLFKNCCGVLDIIYNPYTTKLLFDANKLSIPCANGLSMLVAQAKKASELFTDKKIPDKVIDSIIYDIEKQTKNIILIGMPGSGKSTIGKMLAKRLGKPFVDTDEEIEKSGINISDYICTKGEASFRQLENETASSLMKNSGYVIATGGGIVTNKANDYPLKENSIVIFINRPLEQLETKGRPLSEGGLEKLKELYATRLPLYRSLCDLEVNNISTIDDIAETILKESENCYENTCN